MIPLQQRGCPADVLLLIFEEVYRTAPASLRDVRLASRQFNVLVDPIVYRHLQLNDALVNCFQELNAPPEVADARRRIRSAICTFTRQITVNKALNWASVVNLLLSLKNFHHLNWSFWIKESSAHNGPNRIPQSVLNGLAERWPTATISVDNLFSRSDPNDDFSYLPHTSLVSLKLQGLFRRRLNPSQVGRMLKNNLIKCNQLKVLHLLDVQSGSRFVDEEIEQSERLPAIEKLRLEGYFWLHSPSIATSFWDWTRLTSLKLEKVFIVNFLESVSPENLIQLRCLITDGHCQSAVDHTKATTLMTKLVRAIHSLENLSLNCSVVNFPIDVIRKHAPGLRVLRLREYDGIVHRPLRQSRVPTLSLHALLEIQSCCSNVMELALDLDQGMMSSSFTSLLTESRNLRRLTMFVQQPFLRGTDLNNEQEICPNIGKGHPHACFSRSCLENIEVGAAKNFIDRTYEATCTFFQDLLLRKQGIAFERLTLHVAGKCDTVFPEVLSAEGQRQEIRGMSHKRSFVYEPMYRNGRPTMSFEKQSIKETTGQRPLY